MATVGDRTMTEPALFDLPEGLQATAQFSDDGVYRYSLTRRWAAEGPQCLILMLNPSTADETEDDATVRRCAGFARRLDSSGLCIANLYALRATDPRRLWTSPDPVGPDNDAHLAQAIETAISSGGRIIAAWGAHGRADRVQVVLDLVGAGAQLWCLGVTKGGAPRHPLYLRSDATVQPWPAA